MSEDERAGYRAAIDLWTASGHQNWSRFNAMLVANAVIVAAIVQILVGKIMAPWAVLLPIVGLVLCGLWFIALARGLAYQDHYVQSARQLEDRLGVEVNIVRGGQNFAEGRMRGFERLPTRGVMYAVIGLFGLLYFGALLLPLVSLPDGARSAPSATPTPDQAGALADALDKLAKSLRDAPVSPFPWVGVVTALVAGVCAVGGLLLAWHSEDRTIRRAGLAITGLSLIGGGVTLVKVGKVELPPFNPQMHVTVASPAPSFEFVGHVGPFRTGSAEAFEAGAATATDIVSTLANQSRNRRLVYLILVGAADKFELLPRLQARFGSNNGLARARADELERALSRDARLATMGSAAYLTLTIGPVKHGSDLNPEDTKDDRSVNVYAAWQEPGGSKTILDWFAPTIGKRNPG
jgi:hypothetical protein